VLIQVNNCAKEPLAIARPSDIPVVAAHNGICVPAEIPVDAKIFVFNPSDEVHVRFAQHLDFSDLCALTAPMRLALSSARRTSLL
jgi:hypothetical protein